VLATTPGAVVPLVPVVAEPLGAVVPAAAAAEPLGAVAAAEAALVVAAGAVVAAGRVGVGPKGFACPAVGVAPPVVPDWGVLPPPPPHAARIAAAAVPAIPPRKCRRERRVVSDIPFFLPHCAPGRQVPNCRALIQDDRTRLLTGRT
jgi:hypothetical protein